MPSKLGDEPGRNLCLHGRNYLELPLDGATGRPDEFGDRVGFAIRLDENRNVLARVSPGPVVHGPVYVLRHRGAAAAKRDDRHQC